MKFKKSSGYSRYSRSMPRRIDKRTKILAGAVCAIVAVALVIAVVAIVNAVRKSSPASADVHSYKVVLEAYGESGEAERAARGIAEKTAQQLIKLGIASTFSENHVEEKTGDSTYIRILCDSDPNDAFTSGISAVYGAGRSKKLANALVDSIINEVGINSRGVNKDKSIAAQSAFCVLTVGYYTNELERKQLESSDYQIKLAEAIAKGTQKFLSDKDESQNVDSAIDSQISSQNQSDSVATGGLPSVSSMNISDSSSSKPSKGSKKKTMYLTFDDGPSPKYTEKILDILKKNHAKATFFLVGKNAEEYPKIVKRIAAEGHTIGIHCYEHNYDKIYKSCDAYVKDFVKAQKAIEKITGTAPTIFRFPGGSINNYNKKSRKDIIRTMTKNGYKYFDWNAFFGDAGDTVTTDGVVSYAIKTASDTKKEIIMLAHDAGANGNTSNALQRVIDHYKGDFNFKALQYDTKPVHFGG